MAHIDKTLQKQCQDNPDRFYAVVITLATREQPLKPADFGLTDAEAIGGLGIFKGAFTGEKILELSQRSEVEEIMPDIQVTAL